MGDMSISPPPRKPRRLTSTSTPDIAHGLMLDLERYVPAFITFIANKLSNSASAFYQRHFGVNVTEWRIMSLLAIEPGSPASPRCHVIRYDKGAGSRALGALQERRMVA